MLSVGLRVNMGLYLLLVLSLCSCYKAIGEETTNVKPIQVLIFKFFKTNIVFRDCFQILYNVFIPGETTICLQAKNHA